MGEFDSVDEELFSLDFQSEGQPEPATVRLEERTPRLIQRDGPGQAPLGAEPDRDPVLVIAFAGLLVLVLVSFGVVFWWWT